MSNIAWDLYPKDVFRWVSFGTTATPSTATTIRRPWGAHGLSAFNDVFVWKGYGQSGVTPDVSPSTGGKGDNPAKERRVPFKPTGLLDRPARKAKSDVDRRIEESSEIHAEVHAKVAREFGEETLRLRQEPTPVERMSLREIDAEIALLLRKKLRTEEEEIVLLLLIAATA